MDFSGYQSQQLPRIGSLVQSDDVTALPYGCGTDVENIHYRSQTASIRDGIGIKLNFGGGGVGGFGILRYLAPDNSGEENISIIAATQDGNIKAASPFVAASVTTLTTAPLIASAMLSLQPGLFVQACQSFNKMVLAQGNLTIGVGPGFIVDGATLTCDPVSDKPFGDTWLPATRYRVGQVVSPSAPPSLDSTSSLYQCTVAGISSTSEPIWPTIDGASVIDVSGVGNVTWVKIDPIVTSGLQSPPAPIANGTATGTAIPAGATIYLVCSWTNQFGESLANVVNPDGTIGNVLVWTNTGSSAVALSVVLPLIPASIAILPAQYAVTTCNLYGYIATGTPSSTFFLDPTTYAYIGSGSPGSAFTVTGLPVGRQIPSYNNAFTTPAGNVSSGTRYAIVLFKTRTGYITGFGNIAPIRCDISVDGRKMFMQGIPIGPYNCIGRIVAFTVAGQSSAGPYFYIYQDDYEDPGLGAAKVKQTATYIPDNVTTSAYFDFDDSYLPGASDVTDYFDRVEVPPFSDVYFSKSLNMLVYAGVQGFPSGVLVSDLEDPEAVRVPGSIVQVSETDGDRVVCWRDYGSTHIVYKENSAHVITPNDGDPSDWDADELWSGSGPAGPRAVDSAANDQGEKMHVYAHRSGAYLYQGKGASEWVSRELRANADNPGLWDRINWAYGYLIRVAINIVDREVYFHVPLDAATTNSHRITVNFEGGWDEPIIYIQRTGREVPNINGRKWSLDAIAAHDCHFVQQKTSV